MKKTNKKGFTLVEMLVVIAIIAILVAILVPTVLGATKKAKAATDAANLRSALSEFQIVYLTENGSSKDEGDELDGFMLNDEDNGIWVDQSETTCKTEGEDMYVMIKITNTEADACFVDATTATEFEDDANIEYYAGVADGTSSDN